jgi:ketosteroid isomerase-like protein
VSQEQVDKVRAAYEAINRGDIEPVLEMSHEDIVWVPLRAKTEGSFHGHDGIRAFLRDNAESFDEFRFEFIDFIDLGKGRILFWGTVHVRGKGSGASVEQGSASVVWFRGEKASRVEDFGAPERARAALGISEA